jgi:hypothetical protein
MKRWRITAYFPEAPCPRADQVVDVNAGSMHVAAYRGLRDLRNGRLKRLRLRTVKLIITRTA